MTSFLASSRNRLAVSLVLSCVPVACSGGNGGGGEGGTFGGTGGFPGTGGVLSQGGAQADGGEDATFAADVGFPDGPSAVPDSASDVSPNPTDVSPNLADGRVADSQGPDVDPHGGASRWIAFGHSFAKCTWFTADQGFCSEAAKSLAATQTIGTSLYRTDDSGRTWTLVASIDGKNSTSASMGVYVLSPSEIWFITGFVGAGFSGTVGRSINGGATFEDLTDKLDRALADDPDAGNPLSAPFFDLVRVGGATWLNTGSWSQYFAMSPDGGTTWQRVLGPLSFAEVQAPEFIATKTDLLLRYTTRSWGIALYRLSAGGFVAGEATFPMPSDTDHGNTWWRANPSSDGVVFVDRRAWPYWGWPFLLSATSDGGKSFKTVYAGTDRTQSGCVGLRDALVANQGGSGATFVSGIFSDAASKTYAEIRKSGDGGTSWSVLHSEPATGGHTSVALDPTGKVHAMRHGTDGYGNTYVYDAQYVLE